MFKRLRALGGLVAFLLLIAVPHIAAAQAGGAVAVLAADSNPIRPDDVRTRLLATGLFTSVDVILVDDTAATPSLATLQTYRAVLISNRALYENPVLMGDRLHDYLVAGGGVVDMAFNNQFGPLQGAWAANADAAIEYEPTYPIGGNFTLGTVALPLHPVMAGVSTFSGGINSNRSAGALRPDATLIASWSSGEVLAATKPVGAGRVITLNFVPYANAVDTSGWDPATDGDLLMANALVVAGAPPQPVPTLPEWAMILFGTILAGGAALYVQRRRVVS